MATVMRPSLTRTIGPDVEPVSLVEARDQCEIAAADTAHTTKLTRYIAAAREQVEDDTGYSLIWQTFTLSMDSFPTSDTIDIPMRPVVSVGSVTYYDSDNAQQTLATTVYGLDGPRRKLYLKYNQEWPSITEQHNGIVVTFLAGFGSSEANVPRLIKQAVLLQVTKWWAHRGDESQMVAHDTAYERIIRRIMRTSYP